MGNSTSGKPSMSSANHTRREGDAGTARTEARRQTQQANEANPAGTTNATDATGKTGAQAAFALDQVAVAVLRECQNTLMTKLRFLDVALWQLTLTPTREVATALATDGIALQYSPLAVALRFRENPGEAMRDYLHVILHCLFRQPLDVKHDDGRAWSIASDVVVESLAIELCGERFPSADDDERTQMLEKLKKRCGSLSPVRLYRAFAEAANDDERDELRQIETLFARDSHHLWACMEDEDGEQTRTKQGTPDEPSQDEKALSTSANENDPSNQPDQQNQRSGKSQGEPGGNAQNEPDQTPESPESAPPSKPEDARSEGASSPQTPPPSAAAQQAQQDWERIAKQVELDLESHALAWDENASSLSELLSVTNRQTCDYADFLRKFSVLAEDIKVNEDEFDYIFYTYGLERYGNMPLVEPLEYQECNCIREFAIAIDTSGSCSGDVVRTFVSRTYDILKESESYGSEVNVHIIQCDARVQSDTKITSLQELDRYLGSFELRGFGGTDFRPVFDYVDRLIDEGEFSNLRGLVYFTDGLGIFPKNKPTYDTVFVFVNDEMATPKVPPWTMKAVLDEARIDEI